MLPTSLELRFLSQVLCQEGAALVSGKTCGRCGVGKDQTYVGDAPAYDVNMIASTGSPQIKCIGQSKGRRDGESGANSREIRHEALRRLAIRQEDARGEVRLPRADVLHRRSRPVGACQMT